MRKPFICGNWKMYKTCASALAFADEFKSLYSKSEAKVAIAAPYTQLWALKKAFEGTNIGLSAQNMHFADEGAFTGEISAAMLTEIGVDYCIIGHSERRAYYAESNESVAKKVQKAFESEITPIVCVGETLEQRDGGKHFDTVEEQVEAVLLECSRSQAPRLVFAYEPVWAIGTGRTASPQQAQEMCAFIRKTVEKRFGAEIAEEVIIQYGGSVKPGNAKELLSQPDIDGALVGGASLVPADFLTIVNAAK